MYPHIYVNKRFSSRRLNLATPQQLPLRDSTDVEETQIIAVYVTHWDIEHMKNHLENDDFIFLSILSKLEKTAFLENELKFEASCGAGAEACDCTRQVLASIWL